MCDELAAYIEVSPFIGYGVRSPHLFEAPRALKEKYSGAVISGVDFVRLFGYFDQ